MEQFAVYLRGVGRRRGAIKLFESEGEAETFRAKVAKLHPELNTFSAAVLPDDGALTWALEVRK